MKLLKQVTTVLFIMFISSQAYSQISLGGQLSYQKMSGMANFGLGVKGDYAVSDKNMASFGFTYYLPKTLASYNTSAVALDPFTTSTLSQDVSITEKISFINIFVEGKRYFVGETDGDFNVYGLFGIGYTRAAVSVDVGSYDENLYSLDYAYENYSISQLTLNFGIGAEKNLEFGYLFFDFKLDLPANKQNGQTVEIKLPASLKLNLGIRIPLD